MRATDEKSQAGGSKGSGKAMLLIFGLLLALVFTAGHRLGEAQRAGAQTAADRRELVLALVEDAPQTLAVHVKGYVKNPGIYWLQEGQRVGDALELAVLDEAADTEQINLAALLIDGQEINVPGWVGAKPNSEGKYSLDKITALQLHDIVGLSWQDAQDLVNMRLLKQGHLTFLDLLYDATWLSAEERSAVVAYTYVDHSGQ